MRIFKQNQNYTVHPENGTPYPSKKTRTRDKVVRSFFKHIKEACKAQFKKTCNSMTTQNQTKIRPVSEDAFQSPSPLKGSAETLADLESNLDNQEDLRSPSKEEEAELPKKTSRCFPFGTYKIRPKD